MNYEDYERVYLKLKGELKEGTKTNYGIFSHWSENKAAIFKHGWVGYYSLLMIEIEKDKDDSSEKINRMLKALNLR